MIDLDHNATTPLDPRVRQAMLDVLGREDLGNPSSIHRGGQAARDLVETARAAVAAALGAEPLGVTWTSGGTEADALAVLGSARERLRTDRPAGVLSSPIEHPAVLGAIGSLAAAGHPVAWVQPDDRGRITPSAVADALARDRSIGVVSLAAANHELGNAYDIAAIARAIRSVAPQTTIHVDAVQAFGKIPIDFSGWDIDLLSVSAHKIHGPVGVGALVHRREVDLDPLWRGGAQERGRRPGTESVVLTHAFGVAATIAAAELSSRRSITLPLRETLVAGVHALGGRIHGDLEHHTANTVNAAFAGCDGQLVLMALDLLGIRISTGAACSAGTSEPSAVLRALGQPVARAREAIRLSLSSMHRAADVHALLDALPPILDRLREAGRVAS